MSDSNNNGAIVPHERDVLFGRGHPITSHAGNVRLRSVVDATRPSFAAAASKVDKRSIAYGIVDDILDAGGRFLIEAPAGGGTSSRGGDASSGEAGAGEKKWAGKAWTSVSRERAVEKVMHRLREKKAQKAPKPKGGNAGNGGTRDASSESGGSSAAAPRPPAMAAAIASNSGIGANPLVGLQPQPNLHLGLLPPPIPIVPHPATSLMQTMMWQSLNNGCQVNPAGAIPLLPPSSLSHAWSGRAAPPPPTANLPALTAGSLPSLLASTAFPNAMAGLAMDLAAGAGAAVDNVATASVAPAPAGNAARTGPEAGQLARATGEGSPDGPAPSSPSLETNVPGKSEEKAHAGGGSAPRAAVKEQITLREWMKMACGLPSQEAYILAGIELAFLLARTVGDLLSSGTNVNRHGIAVDNVLISMERLRCGDGVNSPSIREVKFAAGDSAAGTTDGSTPLQPRAACASLGGILLEIFTVNRKSSPGDSDLQVDHATDAIPPPKKRKASDPSSDTIMPSNRAHNLLLELEMPLSIRQLVCDLLDAESDPCPNTALTSIGDVIFDLEQMKAKPDSFLFDRKSPQKALDDAQLAHLFGREKELRDLLLVRDRVWGRERNESSEGDCASAKHGHFPCEVAFLSGYAGSGKSSLLRSLVKSCEEKQWFVLRCKFDKQAAPHAVLSKAFDDFFGKWGEAVNSPSSDLDPSMIVSFRNACRDIAATVDEDGFDQLRDIVPNLATALPIFAAKSTRQDRMLLSMDKIGSVKARMETLIHVLVNSISSAGHLLIALDDLQWSDSFVMGGLADFIDRCTDDMSQFSSTEGHGGLFIVGTFRTNEAKDRDYMTQSITSIEQSNKANVTTITVDKLEKEDVTKLLSAKLCLPWRYTRELADLIHTKTRGNPFFVVQFLRTIVSNKMLEFSVMARRWVWDVDVVDMQMISDGVAELLTASLSQLPTKLVHAVEVKSCLGFQVERATIDALDSTKEVLPFSMLDQMELAVKEGILERAGPVYQFTHDIIKESVYEHIALEKRVALHKAIGMSLLGSGANNSLHLLAVDQLSNYCKAGGDPSPEERLIFAKSNARAAKIVLEASSFNQARSYAEAGIGFLGSDHWETQYDLSLDLFEMSASVSCMIGDAATMSDSLNEILSHAKSFHDSLTGAGLLAKLLASRFQLDDAMHNCLDILKHLDEEVPAEVSLPLALKELSAMEEGLRNITADQIKALPAMTDKRKLNAMKFLNMLCAYSGISKPLLLPLLSCKMIRLTLEYGFCEDSIVGIATAGYSMLIFPEDVGLAIQLGNVSESLIGSCPKRNILRSRLNRELVSNLRMFGERWHSVLALFPGLYNSAMLAGDIEVALMCRVMHCAGSFWSGAHSLSSVTNLCVNCVNEGNKHQMKMVYYGSMTILYSCSYLSGKYCTEVEVESLSELDSMEGKPKHVVWQIFMCRLTISFWMQDYETVATLSEEYAAYADEKKHPEEKGIMNVLRTFYEGIAYLSLARTSQQAKWIDLGKKAVKVICQYETLMLKRNIENKSMLLHAELCHWNGDLDLAEAAYKSSIKYARENKFIHEEALAYELYGRFCIENNMREKGSNQLSVAVSRYQEWGAMRKVNELQLYISGLQ